MGGTGRGEDVLKSLVLYRQCEEGYAQCMSHGRVRDASNRLLAALMHLINFADTWYRAQVAEPGTAEEAAGVNLRVSDDERSLKIHCLLSKAICDLTARAVALNAQRRLLTRDDILNRVLAQRKVSDTSAALLFRLEHVTAPFADGDAGPSSTAAPEGGPPAGFPEGVPDSLSFVDASKNGGYGELVGVDEQVARLDGRIKASLAAGTSALLLLYGPPGTGKTSIVYAAARENGLPVVSVSASSLGGEFIGEREQNTADMFDYLERVKTDFVLFVDEADSFLPEGYSNNTQSRLLRVLTINRTLQLVGRGDGVTRLVALASNHADRISRDVSESSFKLLLGSPSDRDQMRRVISHYRRRNNVNLTRGQMTFLVDTALALRYAPGHVSLLMQRLLTNCVIKMLNNRTDLTRVSVSALESPIYLIEKGSVFNGDADGAAPATAVSADGDVPIVSLSDDPRTEADDLAATSFERENEIAFPLVGLAGVNFTSIVGGESAAAAVAVLPPLPDVTTELNDARSAAALAKGQKS